MIILKQEPIFVMWNVWSSFYYGSAVDSESILADHPKSPNIFAASILQQANGNLIMTSWASKCMKNRLKSCRVQWMKYPRLMKPENCWVVIWVDAASGLTLVHQIAKSVRWQMVM